MVGLWFLRPSWFWVAVIGKKTGRCLRSMPKHLSASWAAVQQFYELPKPIKSHQEPCVLWCSAHPPLLTVLWERMPAPHQVPAPLQPHAPCSWQPRGSRDFPHSCSVVPGVPPPPGSLDVSRQATEECLGKIQSGRQGKTRSGRPDVEIRIRRAELSRWEQHTPQPRSQVPH